MALAQVLTAVRELILDERGLPDEETARRRYLDTKYPELSDAEREDLAKISPERLKLYTVSIFAGERNVLRSKFPITFELLERSFRARGESFDSYEFVRDLHGVLPWRSALVADLVGNFARYLRERRSDLLDACPGLEEVLNLEEITFMVPRAIVDSNSPAEILDLTKAAEMTLDKILDLKGFIPSFVRTATFSYRCPELFLYRKRTDSLPEGEIPERGETFGIVSRTTDFSVRWSSVSQEMFAAFERMQKGESFSLSLLAEVFLSVSSEHPEEESARRFMEDLVILSCNGALLVSA